MFPILLSLGPIKIYAFGLFLAMAFVAAAFLIWREARRRGMPEEKVLDVLLLTAFAGIVVGRLAYAFTNLPVFSADPSRLFFFLKYPGLSFQGAIIGGGVAALTSSLILGLDFMLILDMMAYGATFASVLGYFGCLLDRCVAAPDRGLLGVALLFVVFSVLIMTISQALRSSAELAGLSKSHGVFFLCYLIFQLFSFLILEVVIGGTGWYYYSAGLLLTLAIFVYRYWGLVKYGVNAISKKRPFPNFRLFRGKI